MTKEAASIDLRLREGILGKCLDSSNSEEARLDLVKLQRRPELAARAATALAKIVKKYERQEGVGLDSGEVSALVAATADVAWLAKEAALQRGLWVLRPQEDPGTGKLTIGAAVRELCNNPQRLVVVEGMHSDKNLARVLALPEIAEQTVAVAALLCLEDSAISRSGQLPVDAAIWEPVPTSMLGGTCVGSAA